MDKLSENSLHDNLKIQNLSALDHLAAGEVKFSPNVHENVTFDNTSFASDQFRFENIEFFGIVSLCSVSGEARFEFRNCTFRDAFIFGAMDYPPEPKRRSGTASIPALEFYNCQFNKEFSIRSSEFRQVLQFRECTFKGPLTISGVRIRNDVEFNSCEFNELSAIHFEVLPHSNVEYNKIYGPESNRILRFARGNLFGVMLTSLPWSSKNLDIEFSDIENWKVHRRKSGAVHTIDDCSRHDSTHLKRVDVYSRLEKYFYDKSDFSLASAFYVNLMRAKGSDRDEPRTDRFLNWIYRFVSNYGTSVWSVARVYFALLIFIPLVLLFTGTRVARVDHSSGEARIVLVQYNFAPARSPDEAWSFIKDLGRVGVNNVEYLLLDRKTPLLPDRDTVGRVLVILEFVLVIALFPSLIIAVKRQFTPKQPFRRD